MSDQQQNQQNNEVAAERDSLFRSRNGKSRRQRDRARAHVDYEEMTVSYGRIKLGVPSGFRELLEDLTRGVIFQVCKKIFKKRELAEGRLPLFCCSAPRENPVNSLA